MNIARQYAEEIRTETNYSPTWLPNVSVAVGAICRLHHFQYDQVSDLASKGIKFTTASGSNADIAYASTGVQSVNLGASGATSPGTPAAVSGSAKISFKNAGAIVFEATGCSSERIQDLEGLGIEILARYNRGEWDPDLVIITEVVRVEGATILISSEKNASIDLSAKGDAAPILGNLASLAKVEGMLQVADQRSVGVKVIGKSLTPLFRAQGVKRRLFGQDEFRSLDGRGAPPPETLFGRVDYEDFSSDE